MNVLPELRDEVVRAAARRQSVARTGAMQRMRRGFRIVPALITLALTAAIAVVAVTELRHRAPGHPRPVSAAHSIPTPVRRLVGELAILRSPQTAAADRWLSGRDFRRLSDSGRLRIVRSLVRAVSLPARERLILYVRDSSLPATTGLGFMERGRSSGEGACCITARQLLRPAGPGPLYYQSGRIPPQVYFEIVPDGVSEVRWTFAAGGNFQWSRVPRRLRRRRRAGSPGYIGDPRSAPLTVTVPVHDNVAARRLPDRGAAISDLWLNAAGTVIARRRAH